MSKLIILLLFLGLINSAHSNELKLMGKALFEVTIFKIDVYEISYYKDKNQLTEIHLKYKRDIEKKYSILGWTKSLEYMVKDSKEMKEKLQWLLKNTSDYKKNDVIILRKEKNKVTILKNNSLVASITDDLIAKLIHAPWIGDKPITNKVKSDLLGE